MSGHLKHFDGGGKNMSFMVEDDDVFLKYNKMWDKIRMTLNIKFHSQPIYDEKYIKTKIKTFTDVINIVFSDNEIPKQKSHYTCIAAICIDSVIKINNKNYPQVYLEQCKYKEQKEKASRIY